MTKASKKDVVLDRILYIHYSVYIQKNQDEMLALINSGSEINPITPVYVSKLGLKVCPTNVRVQKVDGFTLEIFGMVLASSQVEDKLERSIFPKRPSWWLTPV